jgi:antitoxin MazE
MKTRIVKIGNSQGVRIPKTLIEQAGLGEEIEVLVKKNGLLLRAHKAPRAGWAEAFAALSRQGDDLVLDPPTRSRWDDEEWEW